MAAETLIVSERLDLTLISCEELEELAAEEGSLFLFKLRLPIIRENPENNKWLFRRIFLKNTDTEIGLMSFHGIPDNEGRIEIGLHIEEEHQNQGFATEAVITLFSWACNQDEVRLLRYTVAETNAPSMRIIEKLGFTHIGQQIDEEDGPEEIFEMDKATFKLKFMD